MGADTPGQAAHEDGLRAKLAEVTREHALLVRYLGPSATQAALSGLEPRDVVLDEAAQEPKPAPVGPGRAAWLKSVELWGPGHAATFDDLPDLERGQWASIAQAGMDGSEYVRELERRAAQEPHAAPGLTVATFGYNGCLTPDAVYATHIGTVGLSVTVDYGRELGIDGDGAEKLDAELHAALERLLAPYFGNAPAEPQPAPDLEAAFAGGMRVRTGPCTVEAHDREHFQVRTNGHWLCGHLLASVLTAHGIAAGTEAKPAPELAALRDQLTALAAKWDANASRNQRNGQSLVDQGDEYGNEGLAVAEALGACHADLNAILAGLPS